MDLEVTDLYVDKTWVDLDAVLCPDQKKDLLAEGQSYYESLGVEDVECGIEVVSPASRLRLAYEEIAKPKESKLNRALAVSADFDPFTYRGLITISVFSTSTVVSVYKTLSAEGEKIFVLNHSAEARRRTVISRLKDVEAIDRFFLIDKSIDLLAEFVSSSVKEMINKSLPSPSD